MKCAVFTRADQEMIDGNFVERARKARCAAAWPREKRLERIWQLPDRVRQALHDPTSYYWSLILEPEALIIGP